MKKNLKKILNPNREKIIKKISEKISEKKQ